MTNARFHGEARLEFLDSVAYYEAIQAGLGERFRQSVEAAVELASVDIGAGIGDDISCGNSAGKSGILVD